MCGGGVLEAPAPPPPPPIILSLHIEIVQFPRFIIMGGIFAMVTGAPPHLPTPL